MTKKTFLTLLLVAVTVLSNAQNLTVPANTNAFNGDGVCYYLPKTRVMAQATATLTTQKPGPFYKYSERYLGISDVITEEKATWALDDIDLFPGTMIDSTKYFKVILKPNSAINAVHLTNLGMLTGINCDDKATKKSNSVYNKNKEQEEIKFDLTQLGEEALVANSIPKMAEIAAKQIYAIRESRANLLSGDNSVLPDGKALEIMLKELKKNEDELMALFVGKTTTFTTSRTYSYVPNDSITNYVLLRFSTRNGLVEPNDMVGSPVYLTIVPKFVTPSTEPMPKKWSVGLYYNKVGTAMVTLFDNKKTYASKNLVFAQFGIVESLPASLFDNMQVKVKISQYTGELISISY